MHLSPLLQLAEHWRVNPRPELETFLRDVADGRAIFASLSAEAGFPLVTDSGAIMRRVEGGYRVSGRKIFGTNNAVCTHFSTMARYEDPELGPRIFFFRIRRDAEGLAFHETWDTLGMRGTRSDDWSMEDVFVPDESIIHSFPAGHYDGLQLKTLWCVSMPVFGSVYLGVACGAMEWVREQTLKRGLEGSAETQRSFAEMEVLLETSRAMIRCHAADLEAGHYEQLPVQIGMARAVMVKYVTTNNAVAIVDRVMELAGGMAYFRRFPLERMFRDVRAGLIHPANNFDARELFAKSSLGIEILPAIPIAEAGPNSRPRDSRDGQTSPLAVAASPA
jgi:alkylation response protein AidB-like acyl-CoA dehydrogenase